MTSDVKQVDIQLVRVHENVFVVPQSAAGMLWLQTHFEDEAWDPLSSGSVIISRHDAGMLVIDAQTAEMVVSYD